MTNLFVAGATGDSLRVPVILRHIGEYCSPFSLPDLTPGRTVLPSVLPGRSDSEGWTGRIGDPWRSRKRCRFVSDPSPTPRNFVPVDPTFRFCRSSIEYFVTY